MMQALRAAQAGGPDVLKSVETERPSPGPGQLLVKVAAAGVNFIDTYQRSGIYTVHYPFIPGSEIAGTVEAVGPGVVSTVGDRVATAEGRTLRRVHAGGPRHSTSGSGRGGRLTAAALPLQGITAHYLINSTFRVEPGHTVLLHAGAGGVGLLLTQLLKTRGARVPTTVSTDVRKPWPLAGADEVLRDDGWRRRVRGNDRRRRRQSGLRRRRQGHV